MFGQKGVCTVRGEINEDELLEAALVGGAEFYELSEDDDELVGEVFTDVANLETLTGVLKDNGYSVSNAEFRWLPNNTVEVSDPMQARSLLKLMDALEDIDDVQNVTANFEMADELLSLSMV